MILGAPSRSFVEIAQRALARDPHLAFVTGCGDPLGAPLRPCTAAMLLGRPAVEIATVFRSGELDPSLPFGRETDLALRLLAAGGRGAILDAPLSGSHGDLGPLYRKHQATLEELAEEVLLVKEHWLRVTAAHSRARHEEELRLRRELVELDEEALLLERCLERLR